jgi:hypothetical protein
VTGVGFGGDVKVEAEFSPGWGFQLDHVPHHVQELIQINHKLHQPLPFHTPTQPRMELNLRDVILRRLDLYPGHKLLVIF